MLFGCLQVKPDNHVTDEMIDNITDNLNTALDLYISMSYHQGNSLNVTSLLDSKTYILQRNLFYNICINGTTANHKYAETSI